MTVDDDPVIRQLVATALGMDGHEVLHALDGQDALEKLGETRPDLIVLDVMMPRVNGWQVLAWLRNDARFVTTPVLLLTARGLPDDVQRGRDLGASAVLCKPFDVQQLSDLVGALTLTLLPK